MALTHKQQAFVNAYLRTRNATKAAIEAGYSESTAYSIGWENLRKPEIADVIKRHFEADAMSAAEVLHHVADIARGDVDEVLDAHGNFDLDKARKAGKTNLVKKIRTRTIITSNEDGEGSDIVDTEVELYDRMKALALIGKELGLFVNKTDLTSGGQPLRGLIIDFGDEDTDE
jgi:phage terminase small subunit